MYSDKNKIKGLSAYPLTLTPQSIYERYLKAYKKGVFNYIKEDVSQLSKQPVARKYFSGGELLKVNPAMYSNLSEPMVQIGLKPNGDMAMVKAVIAPQNKGASNFAMVIDKHLRPGMSVSIPVPDQDLKGRSRIKLIMDAQYTVTIEGHELKVFHKELQKIIGRYFSDDSNPLVISSQNDSSRRFEISLSGDIIHLKNVDNNRTLIYPENVTFIEWIKNIFSPTKGGKKSPGRYRRGRRGLSDRAVVAAGMERDGGIDFKADSLNVRSSGEKIDVRFDQAMMAQFKRGDFSGVRATILSITPLPSVLPLFGIKEN